MKLTAQILLLFFISFLITPIIISVVEENADISIFYSFSEEEKAEKEIKAIFNSDFVNVSNNLSQLNSSLIHFENLSKHDKIFTKIFIPPPELV